MAAEAIVDEQLLLVFRFSKLEQQDLGGEVVDVGQSQGHQALVKLVCDDLARVSDSPRQRPMPGEGALVTLTSKEENLCFMLEYGACTRFAMIQREADCAKKAFMNQPVTPDESSRSRPNVGQFHRGAVTPCLNGC